MKRITLKNLKKLSPKALAKAKERFDYKYPDYPYPRPLVCLELEVSEEQFNDIKNKRQSAYILWHTDPRTDQLVDVKTFDYIYEKGEARNEDFVKYCYLFVEPWRKVQTILFKCGNEQILAEVTNNGWDIPMCEIDNHDEMLVQCGCHDVEEYINANYTEEVQLKKLHEGVDPEEIYAEPNEYFYLFFKIQ